MTKDERHGKTGSHVTWRIDELARRLHVSASVIREAIKSGELTASKLGSKLRSPVVVEESAVQEWLALKRISPTKGKSS